MVQFYADEDFPLQVVEALRQAGHDVVTAYDTNRANQAIPDDEVLSFAAAQGRVVLTMNRRDFIRLHNVNADHAGIVVCTRDPEYIALAQRIDAAVRSQTTLSGVLLRVNRP